MSTDERCNYGKSQEADGNRKRADFTGALIGGSTGGLSILTSQKWQHCHPSLLNERVESREHKSLAQGTDLQKQN